MIIFATFCQSNSLSSFYQCSFGSDALFYDGHCHTLVGYVSYFLIKTYVIYHTGLWVLLLTDYPESSPDKTFWGRLRHFCLWLGSGSAPTTFQMEKVLPSLPIPDIAITIKRFLGSLSPYLGKDSAPYQEFETRLQVSYLGLDIFLLNMIY